MRSPGEGRSWGHPLSDHAVRASKGNERGLRLLDWSPPPVPEGAQRKWTISPDASLTDNPQVKAGPEPTAARTPRSLLALEHATSPPPVGMPAPEKE